MPPPLSSVCGRRSAKRHRADRNVAVVSHGQYVPTLTAAAALRVKTAVSKAAWWSWPLTFWSWKWCPSHVWRRLPLPILVFLGLSVFDLGPMYATDVRQTVRRQTADALCPRRASKFSLIKPTPSRVKDYCCDTAVYQLFYSKTSNISDECTLYVLTC